MEEAHRETMHGNVQVAAQYLRNKYWIVGMRTALRQIVHKCVKCVRQRAEGRQQMMADWPSDRVTVSRPFSHCGVDYAGPVKLRAWTTKGAPILRKAWIAVFKCMWTKATHLELVTECTSTAFLAALDRLIARRGAIDRMRSDNATLHVGADRELREVMQLWNSREMQGEIVKRNITWIFNAPYAPHQGGLWEATVKSMKYHLKRVIDERALTYEEYYTVLTRIEAVLNSRPLTALTDDPTDATALTPAHFLIGEPILLPLGPQSRDVPDNRLNAWERLQKMHQLFCEAWQNEYLPAMQLRNKWRVPVHNLTVGDLVYLIDDQLPPGQWLMGRITEVFPGADGLVRNIKLRTKTGEFIRAAQRCCYLPLERSYSLSDSKKTA